MSALIRTGDVVDGYAVGECLHAGGNGYVYRVTPPVDRDPGFALVMKVPALGPGEPTLGVVSFEIEHTILPTLTGEHVPRVVAVGDLSERPFIVMERIDGESLEDVVARAPLAAAEVATIGASLADAVHSVHRQEVIHLDLKPENFILREGSAVLLDFGFARHAHFPDLLAEERMFAAGSAAYVSPEQLQGNRADLRSDIFSLGVLLFELATGEKPFDEPQTYAGMRDRLWRTPPPPRSIVTDVPGWLQEIILHCLETNAEQRYGSAAHVAFDLRHPDQVPLTRRSQLVSAAGLPTQVKNWWRARRRQMTASAAAQRVAHVPVVLVAVDTEHPDDARHPALQRATREIVSLHSDYRLMLVSVIRAARLGEGAELVETASGKQLEHRNRLRHWVAPLKLPSPRTSLHVIESADPADTLLELARANHVDLIVIGAPGPSQMTLAWWRSVASSVTANAPCSVHVVRTREPAPSAAQQSDEAERFG